MFGGNSQETKHGGGIGWMHLGLYDSLYIIYSSKMCDLLGIMIVRYGHLYCLVSFSLFSAKQIKAVIRLCLILEKGKLTFEIVQ